MIVEIIVAIYLTQKLKKILEEKGIPIWRYIFLGILLLTMGEFSGVMLALFLGLGIGGTYLFGICGLAIGGYFAYYVVDRIEPAQKSDSV